MEIKSLEFWRGVLAEFMATLLFIFVNCGVTLTWNVPPSITQISLCFGLSIAVLAQIFGPSSGAHINPAVTIGLWVSRRIKVLKMILYIIFQCAGGISGAAICYAITPNAKRGSLGAVSLGAGVTRYQGFALEGVLTFLLMMTVLAATDPNREDKTFGPALSIGLAVTVCHLIGIPFTGCGINPARAIAPAILMNLWPNYHWIYWAGPILGATLAGGMYKLIFQPTGDDKSLVHINDLDYVVENHYPHLKGIRANDVTATTGF